MRRRTLWILTGAVLAVALVAFALGPAQQGGTRESPEEETGLLYEVMVALGDREAAQALKPDERKIGHGAMIQRLEGGRTGEKRGWAHRNGTRSGTLQVTASRRDARGRPCRTLDMEWIIGGFEGGGTSEFCKVDEEEWELVRE